MCDLLLYWVVRNKKRACWQFGDEFVTSKTQLDGTNNDVVVEPRSDLQNCCILGVLIHNEWRLLKRLAENLHLQTQ